MRYGSGRGRKAKPSARFKQIIINFNHMPKFCVLALKHFDAELIIEAKTEDEALKKAERLNKQNKIPYKFTEVDFHIDPTTPILE